MKSMQRWPRRVPRDDPASFLLDEVILNNAMVIGDHNVAETDMVLWICRVGHSTRDARQDHGANTRKIIEKLRGRYRRIPCPSISLFLAYVRCQN